jgi:Ca-activated chloride channel family protein
MKLPEVIFLLPEALWCLALIPLLAVLYLWLLGRRKKITLSVPHLGLIRSASSGAKSWRRHVPAVLIGLALTCLLLAMARPSARISLLSAQRTIVLAMDVSGSMRATDVQPNRLVAAQSAAKAFLADLPRNVRVAVVSFAGTAALVQAPTLSRNDVIEAIDRFQLQRGTAIGSGIVLSLATLFPDAAIDLSQVTGQQSMPGDPKEESKTASPAFVPIPPGSYNSAAIILLTDGQRTTGPDVMESAKLAAERGVRVYTVGVGTKEGDVIGFEGWSMRVKLDEETLQKVSSFTHGEYFYAGTAEDLKKVYKSLSSRLVLETKETEISFLFAAAGALLLVLGTGLSLTWFARVL